MKLLKLMFFFLLETYLMYMGSMLYLQMSLVVWRKGIVIILVNVYGMKPPRGNQTRNHPSSPGFPVSKWKDEGSWILSRERRSGYFYFLN